MKYSIHLLTYDLICYYQTLTDVTLTACLPASVTVDKTA